MTMAKFYRVTGNSTQRVGISPDVHFPTAFNPSEVGESSQPNALPWDEILSAQFKPTNQINQEVVDQLNDLYRLHLNSDPDLKKLVTEIERIKKDQQLKSVSLNIEDRRNDQAVEDELEVEVVTTGDIQKEDQGTRLSKDPYLKEALRLLIELSRKSIG
jgi:carboxyl-terminal processing protease